MNYFFHPGIFSVSEVLTLSEEEGRHAVKVLRASIGDMINILNGKGQLAAGEILTIKGIRIEIGIRNIITENHTDYQLEIGLAMLKKRDRLEWFIEKAVELGADRIIMFNSQHTEKSKIDLARLTKIAISALKQSGNLWLPEIEADQDFNKLIGSSFTGSKFIAHCREEQKQLLSKAYKTSDNALVLIGPEGDFSEQEIKQAVDKGFAPVSLGALRLRSETAALAALLMLQIVNQ